MRDIMASKGIMFAAIFLNCFSPLLLLHVLLQTEAPHMIRMYGISYKLSQKLTVLNLDK